MYYVFESVHLQNKRQHEHGNRAKRALPTSLGFSVISSWVHIYIIDFSYISDCHTSEDMGRIPSNKQMHVFYFLPSPLYGLNGPAFLSILSRFRRNVCNSSNNLFMVRDVFPKRALHTCSIIVVVQISSILHRNNSI